MRSKRLHDFLASKGLRERWGEAKAAFREVVKEREREKEREGVMAVEVPCG